MRNWNLGLGDPINLSLAADARLDSTDYTNDQIWQITLQGGEPPSVCLQTTYGLRAQSMRFFPRILHKGTVINDPAEFDQPPRISALFPNYIRMAFWPFSGVEIKAEYWIPSSQTVSGRFTIRNHHVVKEDFTLEWVGLLRPIGEGEGMSVGSVENTLVLQGKSEDLHLICLFNARPQAGKGPYPALSFDFDLLPGNTRQLTWALAGLTDINRSFHSARQTLDRQWEAEIARIEILNNNQALEIYTGDEEWDAAFALAQKAAFNLFQSSNQHLAFPSFILSRKPDDGYSPRRDGSDYSFLWDGQTALDSYYISSLILPGGANLAEGLLRNFLATQAESGQIEWKPSLAGKETRRMAQPVLATLAWEIDECKDDHHWLQEIYPALLKFFKAWFSPEHDRDQDGFPEWDHPLQTAIEDNPLYDRWQASSQGMEIQSLECPSLAAFLYREALSLEKIAARSGVENDIPWLREKAQQLREQVEETWNSYKNSFYFRDYATHQASSGSIIYKMKGSGIKKLGRSYKIPQRIGLHFTKESETTRAVTVRVTGVTPEERTTEELSPRRWAWLSGHGSTSSQNVYLKIEQIEVEGAEENDLLVLSRPDYLQEDISLLLPLWAGIPSEKQAASLVNNCLLPRFFKQFGLVDFPDEIATASAGNLQRVSPIWNHLIGEGLIHYWYRTLAVDLVTRLMDAILPELRTSFAFRQNYHPISGHPLGESNHLRGLPPIGLFLQAAGIQRIGNNCVILQDFNGFPWPVTVKYHGMIITCMADRTDVTFPNGETVKITSPGIHRVSLT
jgi:hypothetical protein